MFSLNMALKFRQFSRFFSSSRNLLISSKESDIMEHLFPAPRIDTMIMWKKFFFIVAVPSSVICLVNIYLLEEPERPKFVKYRHLRIRTKPYPWGDGVKSLFHNPHRNALPDGYEDEL